MILRKARLEDFEIFKKLYEDEEHLYQFIYQSSSNEETAQYNHDYDKIASTLFTNYTVEQFQRDLESTTTILYMIEDSDEISGYISLVYHKESYRISEWAMFHQEDDKKIEVINCLKKLKLPRLRKFTIYTANANVQRLLFSNGFKSHATLVNLLELEI